MQPTPLSLALNIAILVIAAGFLTVLTWNLWLSYIQTVFLKAIKWTLLEVKPPKDVFKSPAAMELVLNALYQTGGTGSWYDKYWKGGLRMFFSLEIVSLEGSIHFYIRTPEKFRKLIESQIYAQYPQAEVFEVEDYMNTIPDFDPKGLINLWGCNFELTKDDPYPIKTYLDYGLDRAVGSLDEEQRIDPITPTLEFMGSIGNGERVLLQIIVRGATERHVVKGKEGPEENKKWTDRAKEVIKELNDKLVEKDAEGKKIESRRATKGELAVIEAIERNANKFGFDAGMRAIYLSDKATFDANRIAALTGMLRQYNTVDFNGFKPSNTTSIDFPWQDMFGKRILGKKKNILDDYRARAHFYGTFDIGTIGTYFTHPSASGGKQFVLSTEELATLFHLPGRVVETPTFGRLEATKAEPPGNLPM